MQVQVERARPLRFADGRPVRTASALAPLGDGWLVAQDDATHAAWLLGDEVRALRLFPPVEGHDVFDGGRDHLAPDVQAACGLPLDDGPAVLLLGSGSTPAARRAALVSGGGERVETGDLTAFYGLLALALDLEEGGLDIEGVARNGAVLRCYQRGDSAAGVPDGSVDVALPALVEALRGRADPAQVPVRRVLRYELGDGLAASDAVAVPDGGVLLSAVRGRGAGGPGASELLLLHDDTVLDRVALPAVDGAVPRVEGLGVRGLRDDGLDLLAVVDADDPGAPSLALDLRLTWGPSSGSRALV